ncbi:MAG: replicative DNA helicase [Actinomycetaceae bacterium]|nr:replicative DNA helicase [Actinomycetaceae bacterium]MDY6082457.1 replicative DNA helicase [Actinomycetaceae bacterium]
MSVVNEAAESRQAVSRIPPHDNNAEWAVLGSMMLSKEAVADAVEIVRPDDFYRAIHTTIFTTIVDLFGHGEPTDFVMVGDQLRKNGDLDRVGGITYLQTLTASVATPANVEHYAQIVKEQAQLRALVNAGTRIVQLGFSTDGSDAEELVNTAQAEIFAITDSATRSDYVELKDTLEDMYDQLQQNASRNGEIEGIRSGFSELDTKLNGLRGGQMIIVAARPGMGKSTFAMDVCRQAAIHDHKPCAYFSLEMNRTELVMRLLSAESHVPLSAMLNGDLTQPNWDAISRTMSNVSEAPLLIDDSPNLTLPEIRAKCRRMKRQYDLQLVVIDYLQLLSSGRRNVESRQQEVSDFSRSIKLLAKELDVPIIAVAQLNRDPEKRNDKRPQVADLRESGSLEQDADVVLLIHRPDQYSDDPSIAGNAEIIVGKQRSGPTGTIELMFQGNFSRFAEVAQVPEY